jgi:hypothetical protein
MLFNSRPDLKPHRKLGFMSTVFDELVRAPTNLFLQATRHCVVGISLENQPEFYIFLKDVVAVYLERVKVRIHFIMTFSIYLFVCFLIIIIIFIVRIGSILESMLNE